MSGGSTRWSSTEMRVTWRAWRGGSASQSIWVGFAPVARKPSRLSISSKLMEPPLIATSSGCSCELGIDHDHTARQPAVVEVVERLWGLVERVPAVEDRAEVEPAGHEQVDQL